MGFASCRAGDGGSVYEVHGVLGLDEKEKINNMKILKNIFRSTQFATFILGIIFIFGGTTDAFGQAAGTFYRSDNIFEEKPGIFYSDPTGHFYFTLPGGWEEIPKTVVDQYMDEFFRQTQGQRPEYTTGFKLSKNGYFQYPYIFVGKHDGNTPSYSQIEREFNDSNLQDLVQQKTAEYPEFLTSATSEKPFVDKERNIIFMNVQSDVVNVGKVNGLSVLFLGKQGATSLHFYAVSSEYSRWLPVFNSIIDSFSYETAYEYDPVEAAENNSPSIFEDVLEKGISGAIIALLVVIVMVIKDVLERIKPKKQNSRNGNQDT